MTTSAAVYGAFVRNKVLESLAFRTRFVVGIPSYFMFVAVHFFIWRAVYAASPQPEIAGYDLGQILTYMAVAWMIRSFYFSRVDHEIAEDVRQGNVVRHLLRPVDYQAARMAEAFGESAFRLLALTLPSAVLVYLFFPVAPPAGWAAAGAFAASLLLSFVLFFELSYLAGLSAAFTENAAGLLRAKAAAVELLSGLLVPLSFFPPWAETLLEWLPFRAIADVPLNLYLGRYAGEEVLLMLALQAAWALGLYLVGRWMWDVVVRRLTIQGG
ncbi:MAG: ABC-2 family transporter protein [Gemmatimonadota bacterium]|nr:ABC-2 family transporter protein [Gemmatimonadota bacterium]